MTNSISKLREEVQRAHKNSKRLREKTGETMETALHAGEAFGASYVLGLLEERVTDPKHFELAGVPIPLAAGIAGHVLAAFGVGRGMESHVRALATGALCAHGNGLGRKHGREMKIKAAAPGGRISGAGAGAGVTASELRDLAL